MGGVDARGLDLKWHALVIRKVETNIYFVVVMCRAEGELIVFVFPMGKNWLEALYQDLWYTSQKLLIIFPSGPVMLR